MSSLKTDGTPENLHAGITKIFLAIKYKTKKYDLHTLKNNSVIDYICESSFMSIIYQ